MQVISANLSTKPQTTDHKLQTIKFYLFSYFCQMQGLKYFFLLGILLLGKIYGYAQVDSTNKAESTQTSKPILPIIKVSTNKIQYLDPAFFDVEDSTYLSKQRGSSKKRRDSLITDSLRKAAHLTLFYKGRDTISYKKIQTHPFLPLNQTVAYMLIEYHQQSSKDDLFYLMAGIIFFLAFIRLSFPKYFKNLFLFFFQTAIRQKQTRDQLLQDNLASLMSNFLFILSASLYITMLMKFWELTTIPFWWLVLGTTSVLTAIYFLKYFFLLFNGWVFNTKEAAGSYIFVVFLVNKVLGVALIPFILILCFANTQLIVVSNTLSFGLILVLFAYRYWVSFAVIRNKLNVSGLHFLLYLCAVELLPLVLIYKVLLNYFIGKI